MSSSSYPNIPEYHCKPKLRLQKPISLLKPEKYPGAIMRNYEFKDVTPSEIRQQFDLVYDPFNPYASTSSPRFSGDFESGNCGHVYKIGTKAYEIHLIPDPNDQQTTQWFFFKVEDLEPGDYLFVIVGFYRQCNLHYKGSKACVYSENAAKNGIGWQRIGENLNYFKWKSGKYPEWAFSFTFTVKEKDTMYFAHAYPYTYTDLQNYIAKLPEQYKPSILTHSLGDTPVPAIFWDADIGKTVPIESILKDKSKFTHKPPEIRVEKVAEFSEQLVELLRSWKESANLPQGVEYETKPVIIIVARTHPGETCSSFAMEGFMDFLFSDTALAYRLRSNFSWLLIPMINPDGVICGFYRPGLSGDDMNRVWQSPDPILHPTAYRTLDLIETLKKTRPIHFFLDFHGHTAACNSFVYGFMNEENPDLYSTERVFPLLMTKHTCLFSNEMCSFLKQKQYEGTMRVVLRRRFLILFAYTLEMSYGGCDFGPRRNTQFTPHDYSEIGQATAKAIGDLLLLPSSLASKEAMLLMPPPEFKPTPVTNVSASIQIQGETTEKKPSFFSFSADDIKTSKPENVKLVLSQYVKEKVPQ